MTSSFKLLFWGAFPISNHNYWNLANIILCYAHFFKPSIQHESKHIVIFRLKLEEIQEINQMSKNNGYLLSHVGIKLFHLNAHVHVICNINLCLQLSSLFRKLHIQPICWNNIWQYSILTTLLVVNYTCNYNRRKGITNGFGNCPSLCKRNHVSQGHNLMVITHHNYNLIHKTLLKHGNLWHKVCIHYYYYFVLRKTKIYTSESMK